VLTTQKSGHIKTAYAPVLPYKVCFDYEGYSVNMRGGFTVTCLLTSRLPGYIVSKHGI